MNSPLRTHMLTGLCAALLSFAGLTAALDEPTTRRVTTSGAPTPGAQVQINQIETSRFPNVVIFATVLKDAVPVLGLASRDFRVREDEVDQEPLTVAPKLTPLSAVLTLDTSGSMKKRLADAQEAAKGFLKTLQPQDKVQIIRFSRDVKTIYPLGADRAAAGAAIGGTAARGDTALWDALYASVESLRDVTGRKAIILLSDGVDDDGTGKPLSKHSVADVLALARQVNVPIYAIGLGTELDELALKKVAGESGALYFNAVEPGELTRLYDSIGKQLAGQYTISYTSNLPADGAEHRVQLRVGESTGTKSYLPATTTTAAPVTDRPVGAPSPVEVTTQEVALAPGKAKLAVRLGPKTPDLTTWSGLSMWKILEGQPDFEGRQKDVAYTFDPQPTVTVNEGDYQLWVRVGDASRTVPLHVKAGSPTQATIVLGAGQVKLVPRLGAGSPPLTSWGGFSNWTVLEPGLDFEGHQKKVASTFDTQPIMTLKEGDYKLRLTVGDASRTVDLSVKAGEQRSLEVVLGAGQVKLMVRLGAGSPPLTSWSGRWWVLESQPDFEGKQKEVATTFDAQPILTLNEGDYKLKASVGDATRTVDLTVKAGEQKVVDLDVTAAR